MLIIDKVLEIANKFIPDKNAQAELEKELRKIDIEELKAKADYVEKINKCIPMVLPAFLLVLLFQFCLNYLTDWFFTVFIGEAPILHIDDRLVEFCQWFMGFLFGKKTVEKFAPKK